MMQYNVSSLYTANGTQVYVCWWCSRWEWCTRTWSQDSSIGTEAGKKHYVSKLHDFDSLPRSPKICITAEGLQHVRYSTGSPARPDWYCFAYMVNKLALHALPRVKSSIVSGVGCSQTTICTMWGIERPTYELCNWVHVPVFLWGWNVQKQGTETWEWITSFHSARSIMYNFITFAVYQSFPYTAPGALFKKSMLLDRDFLNSGPGLCTETSGNT